LSKSRSTRRPAPALGVTVPHLPPAFPAPALAEVRPPSVSIAAGTVMTIDGYKGWSKNTTTRRRVASTIKMLNALVVRDEAGLDETVTVSRKAAAIDNGDIGLVAGQVVKVRHLLDMMLVASANDAAEAVAIHIAGSEKAYVALMNAKAKSLGLTNTIAVDPHGLSERERSTANDLGVIARKVLADPVLRTVVKKRYVTLHRPDGRTRTVKSTNLLLGAYTGIEGVKTGYTSSAGYCFVGAAKRGDVELVAVVLGAKSLSARFSEMKKLLDWGFKHCHMRTIVSGEQTMGVVPIDGYPELPGVTVRPETTSTVALFDNDTSVVTSVALQPTVALPVARGSQLGTVTATRRGRVLAAVPLVADADVTVPASLPLLSWLPVWR